MDWSRRGHVEERLAPSGRRTTDQGLCSENAADSCKSSGAVYALRWRVGCPQPVTAPSEAFDTVMAYLWKTPLV